MGFSQVVYKYLLLVLLREKVQVPSILSPTPRRHLLESSVNQHWLNSPAISVTSSRPSSPPRFTTEDNQPATSHIRNRFKTHPPTFSSIYEHDSQGAVVNARTSSDKAPEVESTAMGKRWIRWMHKRGIKDWVIPGIIAASTLVKFAIGLGPYSGW